MVILSKIRKFLPNAALLFGSLVFAFLLGEAGIRAWEAWAPASTKNPSESRGSWIIPDQHVGYRLRPNHGFHNSDGLVGPPVAPKSDKFRVLVLGDSLIYGRENVVFRMSEIINRDSDLKPSEFLNAGVPGYTNYQQLEFLKNYGIAFRPDLVGIVFVLNDLHKFLHAPFQGDQPAQKGFFTRSRESQSNGPWILRLARRSRLLIWIREKSRTAANALRWFREGGYAFDYNPDFSNAWKDEPWGAIESQLGEMVNLGAKSGFGVFLVVVPYGEQLRQEYLVKDSAYVLKPQRKLREICERLRIPVFDLFPILDREKDIGPDRIHLTKSGIQAASAAIGAFLKSRGLIPRQSTLP